MSLTYTDVHHQILDVLKAAKRSDPLRGWVHGHRIEGIAGRRFGARLDELRRDGWHITGKGAGGRGPSWVYRLERLERQQAREKRWSFDLVPDLVKALARGELPEEVIQAAKQVRAKHAQSEQRDMFGGAA